MNHRTGLASVVIFGALAVVGVVADLWSKAWVFDRFRDPAFVPAAPRPLAGGWATFQLTTSFNEGALFGIGQGLTWVFALLSLVAVGGVLYWLLVLGGNRSTWLTIALGLILAGTLGNLFDRTGLHGETYPEGTLRAGQQRYAVRDFLLFTFGDPGTPLPGRYHYPVFNFADVFLVTGAVMLVLKSFQAEEDPESEQDADSASSEIVATPDTATTTPAATPETGPPGPPRSPGEATAS
ncbi:MAG: peptidase A8 [Planctomycetaceae bacterium]|jgi:signal peptidase II|nr:peptidase A8 [Planctomycetaceae bacterium]